MKRALLLLLLSGVFSFTFAAVGKITFLQGDVNIMRAGQANPASVGFELQNKDSVLTKGGSKARMVFEDGTTVNIGKNTEFSIEDYVFDEANNNVGAKFSVPAGLFTAATGKISKISPDKFKLATNTATIGIRGTEFTGNINPLFDRLFCTQGVITVSASGATVAVEAGFATTVNPGQAPSQPEAFDQAELDETTSETGGGEEEEGDDGLGDALEGTEEESDAALDTGTTETTTVDLIDTTTKSGEERDTVAGEAVTNTLTADITKFDAGASWHVGVGTVSQDSYYGSYVSSISESSLGVGYDSSSGRVYGTSSSGTTYIESTDYSSTDNSYSYLAWGMTHLSGHTNIAPTVYGTGGSDHFFVVGDRTETSSMPTSGTATYNANVHGYIYSVSGSSGEYSISRNHTLSGTLSFNVTFYSSYGSYTGTGTFKKDGATWVSMSTSGTSYYSYGYFAASMSATDDSGASGYLYGIFYGPSANEVGGTVDITYSSEKANGVFVGSRSSSSSSSSTSSIDGSIAAVGLNSADTTLYTSIINVGQSGTTLSNLSDTSKTKSVTYYDSSSKPVPSSYISSYSGSTAYSALTSTSYDSSDYSYLDWGYWLTSSGADSFYTSNNSIASTTSSRSYFASSENYRLTTLPSTGSATYTGAVSGGISNGSSCYDAIGNFTLNANFAAQTVQLTDMDIYFNSGDSAGYKFAENVTFDATSINSDLTNNNAFNVTGSNVKVNGSAGNSVNQIKGDFYGTGSGTPTNVGGTWVIKNGSEIGAGAFVGK